MHYLHCATEGTIHKNLLAGGRSSGFNLTRCTCDIGYKSCLRKMGHIIGCYNKIELQMSSLLRPKKSLSVIR
jgi:hypothetical protein